VEVIADGVNGLAGPGGRHGERLKAFVIGKAVGDGCRSAAAADETDESAVWPLAAPWKPGLLKGWEAVV
jgi:hypothetical protein